MTDIRDKVPGVDTTGLLVSALLMALRTDQLHSEGKVGLNTWQQAKDQLAFALEQSLGPICDRIAERKLLEMEREIADLRVEMMGNV
jgi:hypothetical protein